jgi:uncharacterized protein
MSPKKTGKWAMLTAISSLIVSTLTAGCSSLERRLMFYPTHSPGSNGLTPWTKDGTVIGYSRTVASPKNVWLMLHGNGGQASSRVYALPCFSGEDSVFILEYPGYGIRKGVPSRDALDRAAQEAYLYLLESYPNVPVCVVGESIGSGPASFLANLGRAPDKIVLVVPFDRLSLVARDHFPAFLVRLLLSDDWDNVAALANYRGPIEIYGAQADTIIPVRHAEALAAAIRSSKFTLIAGGHNDWSYQENVRIRNP